MVATTKATRADAADAEMVPTRSEVAPLMQSVSAHESDAFAARIAASTKSVSTSSQVSDMVDFIRLQQGFLVVTAVQSSSAVQTSPPNDVLQ